MGCSKDTLKSTLKCTKLLVCGPYPASSGFFTRHYTTEHSVEKPLLTGYVDSFKNISLSYLRGSNFDLIPAHNQNSAWSSLSYSPLIKYLTISFENDKHLITCKRYLKQLSLQLSVGLHTMQMGHSPLYQPFCLACIP